LQKYISKILYQLKLGKSNTELQGQLEDLDSESESENEELPKKLKMESKFSILKDDLRINLLMEEFWDTLKDWALKYTPISTFKTWENRLKLRLHNFPVGQELILSIDSEEMLDFSSTVFDYLKLLFKYFKPFPEIKNKIDKKILAWRANKSGMMKNILDLPVSKCDSYRVKKIVEAKLQQEDELGIDLSGMAPENRKICLNALFNAKKRQPNPPQRSKSLSHPNPNLTNPNNPSYRGNSKERKKNPNKTKKPSSNR
jgi:hypothetical protein